MKKQQRQGRVDNPTSLEQPQLSQWIRRKSEGQRVMKTYLLALMPSLRVAKPSATRDSAMFSPLVSEEKKRELNTRFKSASNDNRAQMKSTFILSSSRRMMLLENWKRQQCGVVFLRKTFLPKSLISKIQRSINLFLRTLFLSFLCLSQAKGNLNNYGRLTRKQDTCGTHGVYTEHWPREEGLALNTPSAT